MAQYPSKWNGITWKYLLHSYRGTWRLYICDTTVALYYLLPKRSHWRYTCFLSYNQDEEEWEEEEEERDSLDDDEPTTNYENCYADLSMVLTDFILNPVEECVNASTCTMYVCIIFMYFSLVMWHKYLHLLRRRWCTGNQPLMLWTSTGSLKAGTTVNCPDNTSGEHDNTQPDIGCI